MEPMAHKVLQVHREQLVFRVPLVFKVPPVFRVRQVLTELTVYKVLPAPMALTALKEPLELMALRVLQVLKV
jgi:hypothetical protein